MRAADIGALAKALAESLDSAKLRQHLTAAAGATATQFTEAPFLARFDAMLEAIG